MEVSATVSSHNNSERNGKPRITRLLRSVRKRHLPTTRPPLPSFTAIRDDDEDNEQDDEVQEVLDTKIPKVWAMNEKKRTSDPTSLEIHVRPPTASSGSGSEAAFSAKRERALVQAPSPLGLKPQNDARARKERKRRRRELLDMPLPDIPQEPPDPEPSMQEEHTQTLDKPIQYLPQEIYSHLFEVAEREIRRSSIGSTDDTLSVLSVPQTDAPTESEIPLGAVHSIIHSHRYREKLSEMLNLNSTAGQAPNYAKVFEATAKDEQKVAELFEVVLSTDEERNVALSLRGADAESFMDALQHILDENKQCLISRDSSLRSAMQKLLIQLSKRSTNLPETMFISGVEPVTSKRYLGGTFGDVYTSVYQGKNVALKMLRTFQTQADKSRIYKRFCKEALIWQKLKHEFVVPFLGIDAENFPRQPCMVSPWMVNGTLNQFLRKNPRCNLDKLLYQIIQGIDYLHSQGVVHGDLKGCNILIDENCDPRLADFGLTIFAEATMQSTTDHGGTLRWMAPELLYAHGEPQRRSFASDIYAYACVCVEVYTGNAPFADIRNEGQVITQILQGARPARPEKMTSDSLWKIVKHCWQVDKDARPKSRKVVNALRELMKSKRNTGTLEGVETYGHRLDVPGRPFTPFATLEEPSSLRGGRTATVRLLLDQDVEDEYTQCLKRVRRHADPHRMYHHLELLQQSSSVNLFTGRIKGTNSAVTVKQVDFRQHGLTKRLSRLIDEFQDMRFLHHPNILNYVDLFQHDNHIWIVMESMKESVPLSKLLERTTQSGGLKDSFLANVIRHITQAVHYLHKHGIVHGSISSEHVLLGTGKNLTARLKLGAMIDDPIASSHKGTLPAPEARQGMPGPEADIWDLGLLGIAMWDSHIDLTRERDDLLLDVLQNPTPPTIPMRSYLNQTLNVKPDLRPTAASLLQHPFLCNVGTMRSGQKDSSGLNRSLTDPKQRSRELLSSSQVGRSRTSRR